jgi:hypothetical protein
LSPGEDELMTMGHWRMVSIGHILTTRKRRRKKRRRRKRRSILSLMALIILIPRLLKRIDYELHWD